MNRSFVSRFAPLALLGALTFGPACNKQDDPSKADPGKQEPAKREAGDSPAPKVDAPAGPVANPVDSPAVAEVGAVVATVQLPSGTKMSDIAAVIDSIQPGSSAMLTAGLPAALKDATGFDIAATAKLDAPLSFVIVDPASHPKPLALLIEAKDAAALSAAAQGAGHAVEQRGDLLLIGPPDVVAAAKDFAFSNLVKYPDHSEIIVYPAKLMPTLSAMASAGLDSAGAMMAAQGGENMAQMLRNYVEGMISVGEQAERVVISVTSGPGTADVIARIYPVADSTLAKFIAAQQPSDHALLAKLPAGSGGMIMSGTMIAGPAREPFVKFATEVMGPMYGGISAEEWEQLMQPWLDNLDGRFALSMSMTMAPTPGMQMLGLMGVNDSATLWAGWRAMLSKMAGGPGFEVMGMKILTKHEQKVLEHDGVEVDLYSTQIDTSTLPPEQAAAVAAATQNQSMYLTAFDEYAAMASFDPEGQSVRNVIDAARGKGDALAISAGLTTVLDAAKARGDSMVMYMDLGALMGASGVPAPQAPFSAVSVTMGKQDAALASRLSIIK